GDVDDATLALLRLIDFFKAQDITVLCASLTPGGAALESSHTRVSSLMDSWVLVRDLERNGERRRSLAVLKSRGMKHSNKVRELLITDHGVELHPSKDFALAGEDGHA
ncbi:MAG: ATPase domain-containing protein, partial [Thiohalobacteraceae bacterium]